MKKQREIKFRVWDKEGKKLSDDFAFIFMSWNGSLFQTISGDDGGTEGYEELTETTIPQRSRFVVSQFTGLLDKNGKEIYEGDIVKDDIGGIWKVGWNDEFLSWYLWNNGGRSIDAEEDTLEIIGNIYENPELLKK